MMSLTVIHLTSHALALVSFSQTTMFALLMKRWREEDGRWLQNNTTTTTSHQLEQLEHGVKSSPAAGCCYKMNGYPTWTACKSRLHCALTSSKGHRRDSMRRWARMSFRSLLGGLPEAGDKGAGAGTGPMASTFLMTSWQMMSMASVLEMTSLEPSPSHLPRDSWSLASIALRIGSVCAVSQQVYPHSLVLVSCCGTDGRVSALTS